MLLAVKRPPASQQSLPTLVVIEFDDGYLQRRAKAEVRVPLQDITSAIAYAARRDASVIVVDMDVSEVAAGAEELKKTLSEISGPILIFPRALSSHDALQCTADTGPMARSGGSFLEALSGPERPVRFGAAELEVDADGKVRRICPWLTVADIPERGSQTLQLPAISLLAARKSVAASSRSAARRRVLRCLACFCSPLVSSFCGFHSRCSLMSPRTEPTSTSPFLWPP